MEWMGADMLHARTIGKLFIVSLFFTVATWSPQLAHAAPTAQSAEPSTNTVRLMVKIDPATHAEDDISILFEAEPVAGELSRVGWEVIEVSAAEAPAVMAQLAAEPGVMEVTPDYPLELAWNPNDPGYLTGEQWSLDKIGADVAWAFSAGEAITVAVIDSGIDHNHPDLVGRIVPGYNFTDDNEDTTDLCGHGTHVAGIVAAETGNAIGVAGIAPRATIMPIKVIGESCTGSYARLMQGIIYAADHGARVISITSGGGYSHTGLHDAIVYAQEKGVFVAVAAGNRGNSAPFYPGSFEESFTVAGTDAADKEYTNSNFGTQIDISAPAVRILSTYWRPEEGSTYASMTGTSMATPHVAAVAALVLAIDPDLSVSDLSSVLVNSARDLGSEGWDPHFGAGRLTAWRAVAAVSPAAGNVRLGHYRVPNMTAFELTQVGVTRTLDGVALSWVQAEVDAEQSVVIYRSPVPVFEAAEDVDEVAATELGAYLDTTDEAGVEYTYWLVLADNDVEISITGAYAPVEIVEPEEPVVPEEPIVPEEPEEPQEPEEPVQPEEPVTPEEPGGPGGAGEVPEQPVKAALYMPLLER